MNFPHPPAIDRSWTIPPHSPRPQQVPRGRSPLVETLRADPASAAAFWRAVQTQGTPLVEGVGPIRDYTFLHRGGDHVRRVALVTNKLLDPTRPDDALLERVPGTDVWALTLRLGAGWRGTYSLAVDAPQALDRSAHARRLPDAVADDARHANAEAVRAPAPHRPGAGAGQLLAARRRRSLAVTDPARHAAVNDWYDLLELARPDPRSREFGLTGESVCAGPQAPRPLRTPSPAPPGRVESAGTTGRAWWHVPDIDPGDRGWDVLVLADGDRWTGRGSAALDALAHSGTVAPTATLLLSHGGRDQRVDELSCNPRTVEAVLDLIDEAPETELGGRLTRDPERTTFAGQSLGGLQALYAQALAPERFGASISQSGSFWWPNSPAPEQAQWLTRQLAAAEVRLDRVHLEVGLAEWVLVDLTRELAQVLAPRCAHLSYAEFDGGHDPACWVVGLPHAIAALSASRS